MRDTARRTLSVLRFGAWLWLVRVRAALTDTSRAEWAEAELSRLRTHAQRLENRITAVEQRLAVLTEIINAVRKPPESL